VQVSVRRQVIPKTMVGQFVSNSRPFRLFFALLLTSGPGKAQLQNQMVKCSGAGALSSSVVGALHTSCQSRDR
jgi:hypothetical protein